MGLPPQDDAPRRPYQERAQMATDEMVYFCCSLLTLPLLTPLTTPGHGTFQEENAEVEELYIHQTRAFISLFVQQLFVSWLEMASVLVTVENKVFNIE
jgi:hypothetical protein